MENFNFGIKAESKQFTLSNETKNHLNDKVIVIEKKQDYNSALSENNTKCIIPHFEVKCNFNSK